ncbi:hypothetical protein CLIB1444_09S03246 [[Candida] jaroonii]|uniref:Uncharacterized protein n=1 Tax=[Candida] jaroonii TaxID=467808 RepID=A0ACA9YC16_9ASCO|nr:hypothetical protein CLIB1444_09S03246 [[Candida] jaroonii]
MTVAIFTLLYDVSYMPGSLLLASILREMMVSKPEIKLGVLIDKSVFNPYQLGLIESLYDDLIEVSMIETNLLKTLVEDLKRPELNKTFTKIHLWSLEKYDKILYLDSDTLPNKESNLLDLLDLEFAKGKILASPDSGFPDIFNSGMFVLKPDSSDFDNLKELINSKGDISFDGADQGLLNQYFNENPDWVSGLSTKNIDMLNVDNLSNWVKLPFLYNVTPSCQYEYLPAYNYFSSDKLFPNGINPINPPNPKTSKDLAPESSDIALSGYEYTARKHFGNLVKLIHYIGPFKPWNYPHSPSYSEWWSLWYKYFDKETLDSIQKLQDVEVEEKSSSPQIYQYSSKDSLWDPSKSSPPKSPAETSSFVPKKFVNKWDKVPSPPKPHVQFQTPKPDVKALEKESKFGHHFHQKPERVFNDSQNFIPQHPMIAKLKKTEKQEKLKEATAKAKAETYSQGVNASEVNDKLEKLALEQDNTP